MFAGHAHRRHSAAMRPVVIFFAALLLLGACGKSPTATSDPQDAGGSTEAHPWDGLTGAAREKALLDRAKTEGTLSVYSGYNDEKAMADAFTKKYGIKVDVYNANSESVLQRVLQEAAAGKPGNDVMVNPAPDLQVAQEKGILGDYSSEYRDAISDKGKGAQWTGVRRLAFIAGWNTNSVEGAEMPDDYSGFAGPAWKGRISLELSDVDWYATLRDYYLEKGKSERDVQKMFAAIASNSKTVKGHTVQGELMAAGQFDVALSLYSQTVERLAAKGAPVSYGAEHGDIVSPVVVRYDAGAVMKDSDNPAGAALYLDFQLSESGFAVDRKLGSLPPTPQPGEALAKAETIELDVPSFVKQRPELTRTYDQLLRAGTKAG